MGIIPNYFGRFFPMPPLPRSAPELGTAEGTPKTSPHEDKNALDHPSVNHTIQTNTMAIRDRLPPPPTPPSATDITITSPLQQELDAEHTGDPPHCSHGKNDIA